MFKTNQHSYTIIRHMLQKCRNQYSTRVLSQNCMGYDRSWTLPPPTRPENLHPQSFADEIQSRLHTAHHGWSLIWCQCSSLGHRLCGTIRQLKTTTTTTTNMNTSALFIYIYIECKISYIKRLFPLALLYDILQISYYSPAEFMKMASKKIAVNIVDLFGGQFKSGKKYSEALFNHHFSVRFS